LGSIGRSEGLEAKGALQLFLLVAGSVAAIALLTIFARGQRGLLGIALAITALGLLAYLAREIWAAFWGGADRAPRGIGEQWIYDIIRRGGEILFVAEVPGPEEEVRVSVSGRTIEVFGGGGFHKVVKLPRSARLSGFSYLNGVLRASLEEGAVESASDAGG
jgi:HSP20 family protein